MNEYQTTLYYNLLNLVATNEAFYVADHCNENICYRIFNYRLASYSNFLLPSALECRGIMFEIDSDGNPVKLVSLPMHKFFNLNENPLTMKLDLSTVERIMVKSDGSLISTYLHQNKLYLKSKGSLASDQATDAMNWLELADNKQFKNDLLSYAQMRYTINMEWISPTNRIVLGYDNPELVVLNIRDNENGTYLTLDDLTLFSNYMNDDILVDNTENFVSSVPDMTENIEGFVCILANGLWFKCKTEKYFTLHHVKDSINSPRRLFNACVEEATDDMRSLFVDDMQALQTISEMEEFVDQHYNHMVNNVESFYADNKQLERKEFAISAKNTLDKKEFGLAMNLYLGRVADYKEIMKKNWKWYGIQNDIEETE